MKAWGWITVGAMAVAAVIGLYQAPTLFGLTQDLFEQYHVAWKPRPLPMPKPPPGPAAGQVAAGRWRVEAIGPDTYAIGEPQDDLDNYEYLLIGRARALLIDSGSTLQDIRPVIAGLTRLPVTVIPTHLHWDHTNGLRHFSSIALIDLPETRSRVGADGAVHLDHHEYMAPMATAPVFRVSEWVKPDDVIDLGGRQMQVLWTPGHTATSVSIYDANARRLFTGDYMYTTSLYAFMPDSSLSAYEATADRLLSLLPPDAVLYGAHCCRSDAPPGAPWLSVGDLRAVRRAVDDIRSGKARGQGTLLRRYPVNHQMTLITFYPFGNR